MSPIQAGESADDLPRFFERFYRTDDATRLRLPGLGLGLYISRRLVEAHGGRIRAEFSGLGRGSCFNLALPLRSTSPLNAVRRGDAW